MDIALLIEQLSSNLAQHINHNIPNHLIKDVYTYAVLPAGKLFRPQLVVAIAKDFSADKQVDLSIKSAHSLLASAIETHHAYSLVHDDLPSMDNDEIRRGKPSTHIAFGEWKALLVGDGLLNLSYRLISLIDSANIGRVLKFFSWANGPKGLIQGQVLDLSEEMRNDFVTLIDTHRFKTARLIQNAIISSYILINKKIEGNEFRHFIDLFKLGNATGITFQLLDDLTELADEKVSDHEATINPWFNFPIDTDLEIKKCIKNIEYISQKHDMKNYNSVMNEYFKKIRTIVIDGKINIEKNLTQKKVTINLDPIMAFLDRVS